MTNLCSCCFFNVFCAGFPFKAQWLIQNRIPYLSSRNRCSTPITQRRGFTCRELIPACLSISSWGGVCCRATILLPFIADQFGQQKRMLLSQDVCWCSKLYPEVFGSTQYHEARKIPSTGRLNMFETLKPQPKKVQNMLLFNIDFWIFWWGPTIRFAIPTPTPETSGKKKAGPFQSVSTRAWAWDRSLDVHISKGFPFKTLVLYFLQRYPKCLAGGFRCWTVKSSLRFKTFWSPCFYFMDDTSGHCYCWFTLDTIRHCDFLPSECVTEKGWVKLTPTLSCFQCIPEACLFRPFKRLHHLMFRILLADPNCSKEHIQRLHIDYHWPWTINIKFDFNSFNEIFAPSLC